MSNPLPKEVVPPTAVLGDGLRLIVRFVRAHPASFLVALLGAVAFSGALVAASFVIGWVTEEVAIPILQRGEEAPLQTALVAVGGVAVLKGIAIILRRGGGAYLVYKTQQDTRNLLLEHQMDLSFSWFSRQSLGDLLSVVDVDTQQSTFIMAPLPFASGVLILLVGATAMIAFIDPWVGLAVGVGILVIAVIEVRAVDRVYPMWEYVQDLRGEVASLAHETFDGALTVKALGREDTEIDRFSAASQQLRDRLIDVNVTWEHYRVIIQALGLVLSVVVVVVGAMRVDIGAVRPGEVISIVYLLALLTFPLLFIAFILFDLAAGVAAWRRVNAVLEVDDRVAYGAEAARPAKSPAWVKGDAVSFGYGGDPVLRGVDLDIEPGTTVAVVGATAAGKSTLAMLLARLWDPEDGRLRLDGRDLRSFARSELAREVAYVPQSAFLFDDTIRENIALGVDFDDSEIVQAARTAGAHGFIGALPEGYQTVIGERGASLSGGQRQRIALARALVRQPRLLVLDDATSAVDPSVEAEILQSLKRSELPSTVLVVAYRPASIQLADEVVFVHGGRVLAHGDHDELIRSEPAYAALVRAYEEDARQVEVGQ
ncbi:MAG: ATP-binding cassette domain-containing protein [Acidimicrobiia bacterium]|nr:ATP-binding cassette domain-containing protein [Acidimicrobiia bacterium]